ncbi:hypothetical protein [Roseateles chitosanitabidus]|uniref:hypothetical protein n=1 Tax=Roseateles chitosanitabidus TaxID=65048 RepID=UPI00082F0583|nr:hypothetical protein [Roseateles chitosanitabidus]
MSSRTRLAALSLAVAAFAPLIACAQPLPGAHPAYLHALTDLRAARWMLYHQPGDDKVFAEEDVGIREIDATIAEIKAAAIDDGKDIGDHPNVDVHEHGSRLLRAIESLEKAKADISREEDNPQSRQLRHRALEHLDRAIHATKSAHAHWLKDMGR